MNEYERAIKFRLEWIAELEAEIDAMDEGWNSTSKDGARVCAAVLFPEWSPELDSRRTILSLKRYLYPASSPEILKALADVESAKSRIHSGNIGKMKSWPVERLARATESFLSVADKAGLIKRD